MTAITDDPDSRLLHPKHADWSLIAATRDVLGDTDLRPDVKIVLGVLALNVVLEGQPEGRTEGEIAAWVGMTPAQTRQAISVLRRGGIVERTWLSLFGNQPVAVYTLVLPEAWRKS